jgi:hypothetical protein
MKSHRLFSSLVCASLLLAGGALAAADNAAAAKDADKSCCAKDGDKACCCAKAQGAETKGADQKACQCGCKAACKDPAASKSASGDTKGCQDASGTNAMGGK